jgi:integrase
MKGTVRATVKVAGYQKERRFVAGTPQRVIKAWKADIEAKMRKRHPQPERQAARGTLAKDAERYYPLIRHLADWVSRRSEIRAWLPLIGPKFRHLVTRDDVLRARGAWLHPDKGRAATPKTVNNRVSALRDLYRKLDGDDAPTPCDGVKPLSTVKSPPEVPDAAIVEQVAAKLAAQTGSPKHPHAAADRGRLMVLATTGKRPCELERATPADVNLHRRVWLVRDAKGGWSPGVYLNDEMIAAWQAFIDANAWGPFPEHFPRRLRLAGWPVGLRPYNLRHATWIEASERGADLADIQAGAGHRSMTTTRRHYVPVLNSRMQRLSESLTGRFGWRPRLAPPVFIEKKA